MRVPITTVAIPVLLGGCLGAATELDSAPRAETASCVQPTFGDADALAASPRARPDLEALALDIGHGLTADPVTYERLTQDAAAIEDAVHEVGSLRPVSPHAVRELELELEMDGVTAGAIADDGYEPWRCLNTHYDAEQVVVDARHAWLSFDGVYDMTLVASDYGRLPGVVSAEPLQPSVPSVCGGGDAVCVAPSGSTWTYVVHRVDADCRHLGWRIEVDGEGAVRVVDRVAATHEAQQPPWLAGCQP